MWISLENLFRFFFWKAQLTYDIVIHRWMIWGWGLIHQNCLGNYWLFPKFYKYPIIHVYCNKSSFSYRHSHLQCAPKVIDLKVCTKTVILFFGTLTMDAKRSLFSSKTFGLGQTIWADEFRGIWGIFGQSISTHFDTLSSLSMFSVT